jgi:NOL1/NOP2/sun family putative RNA methylase
MVQYPEAFKTQIKTLLSTEEESDFWASLQSTPITSIRIHPKKFVSNSPNLHQKVNWCEDGYYLEARPDFTTEPSFWAGAYYVQEASSMFVGHILQHILPNTAVKVLDLCAAPAGKSTHISSILPTNSLLVSNEVIKTRASILAENMQRWGLQNHLISNNDASFFGGIENFFDIILVDAPCSGEGMFRKDTNAITEWSEANVNLCANRQRRIIADVLPSLKEGGYLLYSTCTYNEQENEENVQWFCENYGLETVKIEVPKEWGIVNKQDGCFRFFPHLLAGEGFFLACLRKKGTLQPTISPKIKKSKWITVLSKKQQASLMPYLTNAEKYEFVLFKDTIFAVPSALLQDITYLTEKLLVKTFGVEMGVLKHDELIPAQALAMNTALSKDTPQVNLSKEQALMYLKKVDFQLDTTLKGWVLATYNGLGLGWLKVLSNRFNNYYPTEWRIRKEIVFD